MTTIKAHIGTALYKTEITTEHHIIFADEPEHVGGTDLGFTPDALLAASLGACTSITLKMYANRKEWNLTAVNVEVRITKDPIQNNTTFIRSIELVGDLDDQQKVRLLDIANKCPVHKILTNPITINTELK